MKSEKLSQHALDGNMEIKERAMQEPQNPQTNQSELTAITNEINVSEASENKTVEPIVEIMPSLEQLLKKAELDAAEHHDAWLRAKADVENVRKRAQADIASAHKYSIENFSTELLAVMDSLDAALTVENATVENFKNGMELTLKQLTAAFNKFNIKVIEPIGEKFDPHRHQAICMIDSDLPPNTVAQVMQKGYMLNDRVIRPALVAVSKSQET